MGVQLFGGGKPFPDEIGHQRQIVRGRRDFVVGRDPVFDPGDLFQLFLGLFGIVPEIGSLRAALLFF